jgi:hypothetical protein
MRGNSLEDIRFKRSLWKDVQSEGKRILFGAIHYWCYCSGFALAITPFLPDLLFCLKASNAIVSVVWGLILLRQAMTYPKQDRYVQLFRDALPYLFGMAFFHSAIY